MTITNQIKQRRSVRTYTKELLSEEYAGLLENYIQNLQAPLGVQARVILHRTKESSVQQKLGTYGYIGGASAYLMLIYEEGPLVEEGAAYLFEQVILYCTELGLGTCWLGGSFSRKDFKGLVTLKPNERLRIVSPVGYASNEKRWLESLIGADKNHRSRKSFGTYFFQNDFSTSLSEAAAGDYALPLEMVRIAPSANNSQPWRILMEENHFHFYYQSAIGGFSAIDLGIALCHFEQTCKEIGLKGAFHILQDVPRNKKWKYSISWVKE